MKRTSTIPRALSFFFRRSNFRFVPTEVASTLRPGAAGLESRGADGVLHSRNQTVVTADFHGVRKRSQLGKHVEE